MKKIFINHEVIKFGIEEINKILRNLNERVEGNIYCDISCDNVMSQFEPKQYNLQYLSAKSKNICEIGVNAGHSILYMLAANPEANVLLFDLGFHSYTRPCIERIQNMFPKSTINIIYGDSTLTIPSFIKANKSFENIFDLIHIDGGHTTEVLTSDWICSLKLVKDEGILVVDDTNYNNINDFVRLQLANNVVHEVNDINILKNGYHSILRKNK